MMIFCFINTVDVLQLFDTHLYFLLEKMMVFNLQFSFEITGKRGVDGQEKLRVTTEAPAAEMPRAQSLFFFILITKRCHSYEESKKVF